MGMQVWRPNVSPDGKRVVFSNYSGGAFHVMDLDGGNLRELPIGMHGRSTEPTWSHDGRIAYVAWSDPAPGGRLARSTGLYVMNGDGSGERLVGTVPGQAQWISWSRDDRTIAVQSHEGSGGNIILVDVATGAPRQITHHDDKGNDETPAWTPDGRLYFQSVRGGRFEIYRMDADGSNAQRITKP